MNAGRKGHVVVAMSGGVDSSVAAVLLKDMGYQVTGLFMRLNVYRESEANRVKSCCSRTDLQDARVVALTHDIPFYDIDFQQEFRNIIHYFVREYENGKTPNPCIQCNRHLKFGKLLRYAEQIGADMVATGHYARVHHAHNRYVLRAGKDAGKDQSYVLFRQTQRQLAKTLLPLGDFTKEEVRQLAGKYKLRIHAKPDSQEICFVPHGDYRRLLQEQNTCGKTGPLIDTLGNHLGTHNGIGNFTIGQRRGLGVALGRPYYVVDIHPQTGTVTLGTRDKLEKRHCTVSDTNWVSIARPDAPLHARVRIRHHHEGAMATVTPLENNRCDILFDAPTVAVTPGQAAVFYDEDVLLGGGWIESDTGTHA